MAEYKELLVDGSGTELDDNSFKFVGGPLNVIQRGEDFNERRSTRTRLLNLTVHWIMNDTAMKSDFDAQDGRFTDRRLRIILVRNEMEYTGVDGDALAKLILWESSLPRTNWIEKRQFQQQHTIIYDETVVLKKEIFVTTQTHANVQTADGDGYATEYWWTDYQFSKQQAWVGRIVIPLDDISTHHDVGVNVGNPVNNDFRLLATVDRDVTFDGDVGNIFEYSAVLDFVDE